MYIKNSTLITPDLFIKEDSSLATWSHLLLLNTINLLKHNISSSSLKKVKLKTPNLYITFLFSLYLYLLSITSGSSTRALNLPTKKAAPKEKKSLPLFIYNLSTNPHKYLNLMQSPKYLPLLHPTLSSAYNFHPLLKEKHLTPESTTLLPNFFLKIYSELLSKLPLFYWD